MPSGNIYPLFVVKLIFRILIIMVIKKELLTIIGVIVILASCQREEIEPVKNTVSKLTEFGITVNEMPDDKTQTRGFSSADFSVDVDVFPLRAQPLTRGALNNDAASINKMGVYGYYTAANSFNASSTEGSTPNYFCNQRVERNSVTNLFSYSPPKFWPSDSNTKMTFFAYSPYSDINITYDENGIWNEFELDKKGTPYLNYLMPTDASKQPDLMVAIAKMNMNCGASQPTVNFTMKHALAAIGFTVSGAGEKITSIFLEKLLVGGKLSMDGSAINWSNLYTNNVTYSAAMTSNPFIADATQRLVTPDNGYFMVPSQTLPADAKLTIKLSNGTQRSVILSSLTPSLKAGCKYIYNIKLKDIFEVIDNPYTDENPFVIEGFSDAVTKVSSSSAPSAVLTENPNWLISTHKFDFKITYKDYYDVKVESSFNKDADAFISNSAVAYSETRQSGYAPVAANLNALNYTNVDVSTVHFNVFRTGPGDSEISGTLKFSAINKTNGLTEKVVTIPIRIRTSCVIGDCKIGSLLVSDRNVGATPKPATALNYTNTNGYAGSGNGTYPAVPSMPDHPDALNTGFKGIYTNTANSQAAIDAFVNENYPGETGWRLPTEAEFKTIGNNKIIYSKQRIFIVSDTKTADGKFIGCYFPVSGHSVTPNDRDATYRLIQASSTNNVYFNPTRKSFYFLNSSSENFVMRCVKTLP